jgi:antitoxin FitA
MSVMVEVRNVPEALHRKLEARAALLGLSLSDLILAELERPTRAEFLRRLAEREPVSAKPRPAAAVRSERDAR